MSHEHNLAEIIIKWGVEHIIIIAATVSGFFGSVSYILHQRFATITALNQCQIKTTKEFRDSLQAHEDRELESERASHTEIKQEISNLYGKVASVDRKVDELTKTILENVWQDKRK